MRAPRVVLAATALLLGVAGCQEPVTEVVVVIDTDLRLPAEADTLQLDITSPNGTHTVTFGAGANAFGNGFDPVPNTSLPTFPATLGLVRASETGEPFQVTAKLTFSSLGNGSFTFPGLTVVQRAARDVRFVPDETRMLVISLLRACACVGTTCPDPRRVPECADLVAPSLPVFDLAAASKLPPSDAGILPRPVFDAGSDVARPFPDASADRRPAPDAPRGADAGLDVPAEHAADVVGERPLDAAREGGAGDGALDGQGDVRRARGATCTLASQCEDGFCIDGVCCTDACKCGTCAGATPGTCVPAAASSDPRNACGSFTCNGAGACETACTEGFGACSNRCKLGAHCDGQGQCVASTSEPGLSCVVGSCLCKSGLACQPPDGGGVGRCQ